MGKAPKLEIVVNARLSGQQIMEDDLKSFRELETGSGPSILKIYSWQPQCISLGYSQKIEAEIDPDKAKTLGWDVVKRPTGGGIVFHNEAEVTYSLVTAIDNPILPKGLVPSYKKLSEAVVFALSLVGVKSEIAEKRVEGRRSSAVPAGRQVERRSPNLCFSYPAEYELVANGKKIVGSAQKRGKRALLQQGSIFVADTPLAAFSILKKTYEEQNAISVASILKRTPSFEELSEALIKGFGSILKVEFKNEA